MTKRVLIIGGYGNFGGVIATALAKDPHIQLLIGGRRPDRARKFLNGLRPVNPFELVPLDIHGNLDAVFATAKPDIVIHTTGPFQYQGYEVVNACLKQGCHYIDLADARAFVSGIAQFDERARRRDILIVTGASSVPCLSAAVIDHYKGRFTKLHKIDYGITAAQQTNRGFGTLAAVFSYVGEAFQTIQRGETHVVYGWQNLHTHKYPELGKRLFGNCDIADLDLFPKRYPDLKTVQFSGGHEIRVLHLGLWLLSWTVRAHLVPSLEFLAPYFLKVAHLFDKIGTGTSGFHMVMTGTDAGGAPKAEAFYIIARSGHGPRIPCVPATLLAKQLASGSLNVRGAQPCVDLIDLDTYCDALKDLDITVMRDVVPPPPVAELVVKTPASASNDPDGEGSGEQGSNTAAFSYKNNEAVPAFPDDLPLIVFDGVCVACSTGVARLMKNKDGGKFRYTSAQSTLGKALYSHYGIDANATYLLLDRGTVHIKSEGILRIAEIKGGAWSYARFLREVPLSWRDRAYDFVATHRYKCFGKTEVCQRIPKDLKKNLLP